MATPRGAEHRDLEQRLRNLENQVRLLTSTALRRSKLAVNDGDFVVSGGGNVIVQEPGDLRIVDTNENVVWSALESPIIARYVQRDRNDGFNVGTGLSEYANTEVPIPEGYTRGHLIMACSVGQSWTAGNQGWLSVQCAMNSESGPTINSGVSQIAVATSIWATNFEVDPEDEWITLSMRAQRSGTGVNSGTGNWHLSASVFFTRS